MRGVQVNIRMTQSEIEQIDKLIENGDFENRTEFVRYAVRKFLKNWDGKRL